MRVVRKSQTGGAQQSKKAKYDPSPIERSKRGRLVKSQLDKYLESSNTQGKYTITPQLSAN